MNAKTTNQQKFETTNTVVQGLIGKFHGKITRAIADLRPTNILELGCGEGFLLEAIHRRLPGVPSLGLDMLDQALENGHKLFPQLRLERGDIYAINQPDKGWDVVVASEVLEHLERPERALHELRRVAKKYVVLSVPWEPWFRLGSLGRGKHLQRFGNHPEHINHWSRSSFREFVGRTMQVEKIPGSFPWTILVARV